MESNKIAKSSPPRRKHRRRFSLVEIILIVATFGLISSVAFPALAQYLERQATLDVLQSVPRPSECNIPTDEQ